MRKLFGLGLVISGVAISSGGLWVTACSSSNNGTGFNGDGGAGGTGGHGGGGTSAGGGGGVTNAGGGGGTSAGGGGGTSAGGGGGTSAGGGGGTSAGGGGGTSAGGGGGTSGDGGVQCAPNTDAGINNDSLCPTQPDASGGACADCCFGDHQTGACTINLAIFNDCCSICQTQCATEFCANPPQNVTAGDPCDTCLNNALSPDAGASGCNAQVSAACSADPDCVTLEQTCLPSCP